MCCFRQNDRTGAPVESPKLNSERTSLQVRTRMFDVCNFDVYVLSWLHPNLLIPERFVDTRPAMD
jgi:hypothetical protein